MALDAQRQRLHRLVDELPASEVVAAERFLRFLRNESDPAMRSLIDAPDDDEPESEAERLAVAEAREEFRRDHTVSLADIESEFGTGG